jgi:hypothetical protein
MWRRFAVAVIIVLSVEAATNLRMLIDPRLLPARCRLFRRMVAADVAADVVAAVALVAVVAAEVAVMMVVAGDVRAFANMARSC